MKVQVEAHHRTGENKSSTVEQHDDGEGAGDADGVVIGVCGGRNGTLQKTPGAPVFPRTAEGEQEYRGGTVEQKKKKVVGLRHQWRGTRTRGRPAS